MKKSHPHLFSYLAALVIGVILFAVYWKTFFGSASSPVVIAGIAGVAMAVLIYLVMNTKKKGPP
jgi:hypothetical protein